MSCISSSFQTQNDNSALKIIRYILNFILGFYFINLCYYIFSRLLKRNVKLIVYWLDFFMNFLFFMIYFILKTIEPTYIQDAIHSFHFLLMINFVSNIFNSMNIFIKINKVDRMTIKNKASNEVSNQLKAINIPGIYDLSYHFYIYFFSLIICVGLWLLFEKLLKILEYSNALQGCACLLQLILSVAVRICFKNSLSKAKFSENFKSEIFFGMTKKQLNIIIEHFFFKCTFDLILNFSTLLRFAICYNEFEELGFDFLSIIIYNILFGSLLLTIDKHNSVPIPKYFNKIYCLKIFRFKFSNKKDDSKLYQSVDETIDFYSKDETPIEDSYLNYNSETSSYQIGEIEGQESIEALNGSSNINFECYQNQKSHQSNEESKSNYFPVLREFEGGKVLKEKDYLPCNFYILFKLLYLFFKKNEKVYLKLEKTADNEFLPLRKGSVSWKKGNGSFYISNVAKNAEPIDIRENMQKISRISVSSRDEIKASAKFSLEQLMYTLNDKIIKDEFVKNVFLNDQSSSKISNLEDISEIKEIKKVNPKQKLEFKIESLLKDDLFELYPFFQVNINDILFSLEIGSNKKLFKKFSERKSKEPGMNNYYTKDSFLSFEIYDRESIKFERLSSFIKNYKDYILEKIANFSYSFLPLILGVFNISYLNYDKIVIVYRNPLSFSTSVQFNCWINFCFSDDLEKITSSTKGNEIVDGRQIEEIEVKNNLKIIEDEYSEIAKILESDMEFFNSQGYELNFKLNLFILNHISQNDSFDASISGQNSLSTNMVTEEKLLNMLRDSNMFNSETNSNSLLSRIRKIKKFYGSDAVSLLEKLYVNNSDNDNYLLKIFFSELFRKKILKRNITFDEINTKRKTELKKKTYSKKEMQKEILLENENLAKENRDFCNKLKKKIFKKISKSESSFLMENEKE